MTGDPVRDNFGPPAGYPSSRERALSLLAHWGGLAGVLCGGALGWVVPLIVYVTAGRRSAVVREHALSALNFYLTWAALTALAAVVALVASGEPVLVLFLMIWIPLLFGIMGAIVATRGYFYRYPTTIRFIR